MNETTNMGNAFFKGDDVANIEPSESTTKEKPYTLRALCAEDIFPVMTIIRKIGIKEFKDCFNEETLEKIIDVFINGANVENKEGETNNSEDNTLVAVGLSILPSVLDIADILLTNIPKCEADFYKFLASISNLSVEEIKKMNMVDFFEMIVDVVKKEEFKDFIKVVSKLFK